MALEIELKARVEGAEAARARLRAAGARRLEERALEDNLLLDDAAGSLSRRGEALRLRLVRGRALLTWKGPKELRDGVKAREELETGCEDGGVLLELLSRLGLRPSFRYQKYREDWELGPTHVTVDETPAGCFVEVEGEEADVRAAAERLGIAREAVVEESYPALFARLLRERGGGSEMVFDGE